MGLGQSYLAINLTFSMLVSESCMQLHPKEGPGKNCEILLMSPRSVERGTDAGGTLALRSQGNGTSHISGVGLSEHKAHN